MKIPRSNWIELWYIHIYLANSTHEANIVGLFFLNRNKRQDRVSCRREWQLVITRKETLLYWFFFSQKIAPRMRCIVGESRVVVITLKWQWKTMEQPEAWWSAYISLNHFSSVEKKIVESGKTTSKLEVRNNHTSELPSVLAALLTINTEYWTRSSNAWLIIIVVVWPNFFTIRPNFVPFLPVGKIYLVAFWYDHCSKDLNTNSLKGKLDWTEDKEGFQSCDCLSKPSTLDHLPEK